MFHLQTQPMYYVGKHDYQIPFMFQVLSDRYSYLISARSVMSFVKTFLNNIFVDQVFYQELQVTTTFFIDLQFYSLIARKNGKL